MNSAIPTPDHSALWAALVLCLPILLLLPALLPTARVRRSNRQLAKLGAGLALATFAGAVIAAIGRTGHGPLIFDFFSVGPVRLGVYVDALSLIMLLLVSFLGAVVTRYAVNYLDGDPGQGRFTKWLSATIGAVLLLIVSGNLLMFALAWMATSLSLHQLLMFYSERPGALLAARKKFLISRLGDAAMVGLLVLSYHCFGTWEFRELFAAADALRTSGAPLSPCFSWISGLLVAAAMLKSAQFPFHSWLPDTMETPTPVSALMHAGIINAGGFLIVRFSPIISLSPTSLNALALVGVFTALFASLIMLTQTSVKRSLAYSTIAQMGFMMLQCGLGAFALAVLHLVAHSLYKAHAFLASGSIVGLAKSSWVPSGRPTAHPVILLGTLATALGLTAVIAALFGVHPGSEPGVLILGGIFMMAVAYLLWNLWSSSHRAGLIGWGLLIGAACATAYFTLHALFVRLLAGSIPPYAPERSPLEYGVMVAVVVLFMAMLIFQAQLPLWSSTRVGRALYVHAHKGFYFVSLANRIVLALTPRTTHR